ncbi:hypothetical protein JOC73_002804 [Alkaliphilus hydrothermalis]|uniref:Uncharacterized protein n=1 Tax=Alkaliphilus hydrothermalis TaxID=1482730 RepID=A0ABS2NTE8_9FIRM|nr:hypothetical protein [Alkaliphilus hydrothermalis]
MICTLPETNFKMDYIPYRIIIIIIGGREYGKKIKYKLGNIQQWC